MTIKFGSEIDRNEKLINDFIRQHESCYYYYYFNTQIDESLLKSEKMNGARLYMDV